MTMIIIDSQTQKNTILVTAMEPNRYKITVFCVKGSGGSSTIPGTPGNILEIGPDNKPKDSTKKAADFATSNHNHNLGDLTDDVNHRTVSDSEKSAWTGNIHFKGVFPTSAALMLAYPTANAGDNANVDAGTGHNAEQWLWDENEGWIQGGGAPMPETDPVFCAWLLTNPLSPYSLTTHNHDTVYAAANHSHNIGDLGEDVDHRTVSDSEKGTWNSKAEGNHNHSGVYDPSGTAAGSMNSHNNSYNHSNIHAPGSDAETATSIAAIITNSTADTIVDADELGFRQAANSILRKITWANFITLLSSLTVTFTNKRITKRVCPITSNANPTVNTDDYDCVTITALATNIASMTTNLSGIPTNFQSLLYRIKDDGTSRSIAWGTSFEAKGVDLPTATVAGKVTTCLFLYSTVNNKWGCVALSIEA